MTVSEINAVVSEVRISATPETVFSFFVDPDKMARWMGSHVELDPRPGGTYALDINAQWDHGYRLTEFEQAFGLQDRRDIRVGSVRAIGPT